ncbi:MaoC family dehydratase [Marinobacter vinifirmus]|uniref:MaoC family dehydratase n=1 Tax=Marinobacter vinifirmus TaxID=355591 RepID=A0A558B3K6_9GAMM|nr:MaoC family dehydratase [Marinobacter vinifirmus]TVT31104.1 MAG: MaoC family dehydratase [Marinobacter vinifirmus]
MSEIEEVLTKAKKWPKGNGLDDMQVGQVFEHHWGRTLSEADNTQFSTMTLHFNPLYFNREYAREHDHPGVVINPMLVFLTVFGLSVEDLSESGGAFLGVEDLSFHQPVYPGETLTARSKVVDLRDSGSRPNAGIATWHTEGFNQRGERVIDFHRTNMIAKQLEGK